MAVLLCYAITCYKSLVHMMCRNMAMGDLMKHYVLPLNATKETPAVVKKHSMRILADLLHVSS